MSKHMNGMLAAYHDGELHGRKRKQVEEHLQECIACRAELEELRMLSALLQEFPEAAELTPADRFVAQVGLQLSRRQNPPIWQRAAQLGWQLVPVGLIAAWGIVRSVLYVSFWVGNAQQLGLVSDLAGRIGQNPVMESVQAGALTSPASTLNSIGEFIIGSLGVGSPFDLSGMLSLILPTVIGLLYLIWVVVSLNMQDQNYTANENTERNGLS